MRPFRRPLMESPDAVGAWAAHDRGVPSHLLTVSRLDAGARATCAEMLAWEGPGRVLTITVDARDTQPSGTTALPTVLRALGDLERADARSPHEGAHIVPQLLEDVRATQSQPLEGGGLAIVADLTGGEVRRLVLGQPPPTQLVVGPRAAIRPILRALQDAVPAGVVRVDAERVEIGEWMPHAVHDLVAFVLPELEASDLRGPAVSHPRAAQDAAPSTRSARQIDLYRRRVTAARRALADQAAARIALEAQERGWAEIVVAGGTEAAASVVEALPDDLRRLVVHATLPGWRRPAEVAAGGRRRPCRPPTASSGRAPR